VSEAELRETLNGSPDGLRISGRTATRRVTRVSTASGVSLDGVRFRQRLGYTKLKSLEFEVEKTAQGYLFTGRGYGHGAGLCQWGTKVLADGGWSYKDILSHYYPGAELQQLY
jgi:stage II sporulation protein D